MLITVSTTISLVGLPAGVTKFVNNYRAKNEEQRIFAVIKITLLISIPLGIITTYLLSTWGPIFVRSLLNSPDSADFLPLFAIQVPANIIILVSAAFAQGLERGGLQVTIRGFMPKLLVLINTLFIIIIGGNIYDVGTGYILARWITALFGIAIIYYLLPKNIDIVSTNQNLGEVSKTLILYSSPLLLTTFTGFFLNWIDTFFVAYYLTDAYVGIYQVAFLLGSSLSLFFTSIAKSLFPNFSALIAEGDLTKMSHRYNEAIRWGLIISSAPFFYLLVFPRESLGVIFGAQYHGGTTALAIILIGQFIAILSGPGTEVIKSNGNTRFIFVTYIIAIIVNTLLNAMLIPHFAIAGAAVATSAAISIKAILLFYRSCIFLDLSFPTFDVIRILLVGMISSVLSSLLPLQIESAPVFVFTILIFILIYILMLFSIGPTNWKEIRNIITELRSEPDKETVRS